MIERPILFNSEMVRSILEERKTQTRRVIKNHPLIDAGFSDEYLKHPEVHIADDCTYGLVGDRLWVRETYSTKIRNLGGTPHESLCYKADNQNEISYFDCNNNVYPVKWKPSIHMPRSASRILLEITNIRVERLNDISEEDAKAEGVEQITVKDNVACEGSWTRADRHMWKGYKNKERAYRDTAKDSFMSLWQEINGADSWAANPWVWVIEFKVLEGK